MRISIPAIVLICATAVTLLASNSKAQTALDKPVTIDVHEKPLAQVLDQVAAQVKMNFSYADNAVFQTKLNYKADKEKLGILLNRLLKNYPYTYTVVDEDIILQYAPDKLEKQARQAAFQATPITGTVLDTTKTPIPGVIIRVKGSTKVYMTDAQGRFIIPDAPEDAELTLSFIGFKTRTIQVHKATDSPATVYLHAATTSLNEVVVSTGYQELPKERATGSFAQVSNTLFNQRVSTDVISRLEGNVPGLLFNRNTVTSLNGGTDISIRGTSTLFANNQPLVVVDNFPYDGDVNNINPNDVESITVLKDAAAASIWGVRSGNGVIVITTKKGKRNQPLSVELNANVTEGAKPDLHYSPNFLPSNDFINIEQTLFSKGYYDADLTSSGKTAVTPVVQTLADQRSGLISQADATAKINAYRNIDVRDGISKYFQTNSLNQQYALNLRGGGQCH